MILLVGSTGRVGRLISAAWRQPEFAAQGMAPVVLQHRQQSIKKDEKHRQLHWDPGDGANALMAWVKNSGEEIDCMVVLAGVTPSSSGDVNDNPQIAIQCLRAAVECGAKRVLIASSASVYGPGHDTAVDEQAICAPMSGYGRSKLDMERSVSSFEKQSVQVSCLRIGNVLGVDALTLNARSNPVLSLEMFGDGSGPVRSYIGPIALAKCIASLCASKEEPPPVVNVAASKPVQMEDLAVAARINWRPIPASGRAIKRVELDVTRLSHYVDIASEWSLPEHMVAELQACTAP